MAIPTKEDELREARDDIRYMISNNYSDADIEKYISRRGFTPAQIRGEADLGPAYEVKREAKGLDPLFRQGEVQSFPIRSEYSAQDTPMERSSYLDKTFGAENWVVRNGRAYITPEGLRKHNLPTFGDSLVPMDDPLRVTRYDIADMRGGAPAAIGGAAAGIALGPYGAAAGILGSALGAGLGKAADEYLLGDEGLQSNREIFGDIGREALWAGIGEGIVRGGGAVAGKLAAPNMTRPGKFSQKFGFERRPDLISKTGPRADYVEEITKEGGRLTARQINPNAKIVGRFQDMMNNIFGDPNEQLNRNYLLRTRQSMIEAPRKGYIPGESVHKQITSAADNIQYLTDDATKQLNNAVIKSARSSYREGFDPKVLSDSIQTATDNFRTAAITAYGEWDNISNGAMLSTKPLKDAAEEIKRGLPKVSLQAIDDLPDFITAKEAQAWRSDLLSASRSNELLADVPFGQKKFLAKAANEMFNESNIVVSPEATRYASSYGKEYPPSNITQLSQKAREQFRVINSWYKAEIDKFDDILINRLSLSPDDAASLQPDQIGPSLAKAHPSSVVRLKKIIPKETYDSYTDELTKTLVDDALNVDGTFNGQRFYSNVDKLNRSGKLNVIYGDKAKEIRQLAKEANAIDLDIPLDKLTIPEIRAAVSAKRAADNSLRQLQGDGLLNWLNANRNNPKAMYDLTSPQHAGKFMAAVKYFGEDSAETAMLRQQLIKKLTDGMIDRTTDPIEAVLDGPALLKQLAKYGEGHNTLKIMLGNDLGDALWNYGQKAALFSKKGRAGELVSAHIALHPIAKLPTLAKFRVLQRFYSSPTGVKWLTDGLFGSARSKVANSARLAQLIEFEIQNIEKGDIDE